MKKIFFSILVCVMVVSSIMRKIDLALAEIHYGGRFARPLVFFQRAGCKGSRAAIRRLSCP